MKAYIIVGMSGEYSDRMEWPVKGYLNEGHAKRECERMCAKSRVVKLEFGDDINYEVSWWNEDDQKAKEIRTFVGDPHYQMVLDIEPTYYVKEVDIVDLGWPTV